MLKLVPFNAAWINHDKIDLHAIYRRPRFVEDAFGEMKREYDPNGLPTWDLTGPLPVKQDTKWRRKGFEYVTLANREGLVMAARQGTVQLLPGMTSWREYDQHQTGGPWNYKKYILGEQQTTTADAERLKADVAKYGWEAVESIRQQTDPDFVVPAHLKANPTAAAPKVSAKAGAAA
jgi:hypothetical protein